MRKSSSHLKQHRLRLCKSGPSQPRPRANIFLVRWLLVMLKFDIEVWNVIQFLPHCVRCLVADLYLHVVSFIMLSCLLLLPHPFWIALLLVDREGHPACPRFFSFMSHHSCSIDHEWSRRTVATWAFCSGVPALVCRHHHHFRDFPCNAMHGIDTDSPLISKETCVSLCNILIFRLWACHWLSNMYSLIDKIAVKYSQIWVLLFVNSALVTQEARDMVETHKQHILRG